MHVGVVGGAGYIGSHVCLALLDAGFEISVFDDLSSGLRENVEAVGAPLFEGSILDVHHLREYFSQFSPDAIVHLAAKKAPGESMRYPYKYLRSNVTGSINLFEVASCHGCDKVVFSSSCSVYGTPRSLPVTEDSPIAPESVYAYSKRAVEEVLEWLARTSSLRFASLRYFNAVGYDVEGRVSGLERDPKNLFPILLEAATGRRGSVTVFGSDYDTRDGTCVRDYVHVNDLADAHVKALSALEEHEQLFVNLGSEQGLTVRECVDAVRKYVGDFEVVEGERRPGDPVAIFADASYAKEVLDWSARNSDVETIVKSMKRVYER